MRKMDFDAAELVNRAVQEVLRGGEHLTTGQRAHSGNFATMDSPQFTDYPSTVTFTYDLDEFDDAEKLFGY